MECFPAYLKTDKSDLVVEVSWDAIPDNGRISKYKNSTGVKLNFKDIDWNKTRSKLSGFNAIRTLAIFNALKEAGIKLVVVYEDDLSCRVYCKNSIVPDETVCGQIKFSIFHDEMISLFEENKIPMIFLKQKDKNNKYPVEYKRLPFENKVFPDKHMRAMAVNLYVLEFIKE